MRAPKITEADLQSVLIGTRELTRVGAGARPQLGVPEDQLAPPVGATPPPARTRLRLPLRRWAARLRVSLPPPVPPPGAPPDHSARLRRGAARGRGPARPARAESLALPARGRARRRAVCYVLEVLRARPARQWAGSAGRGRREGSAAAVLSPAEIRIPVGGTGTVGLVVMGAQDLRGVDMTLTYDPAVLEAQDVAPGPSSRSTGRRWA